ncbi:MAG TPA: DUF3108 domain-containing protein [Verrucomicrobiae bacterium]|nr:DUF3108 domain-containing protein [Verrucomicrobiae bacterium]
MMKAKLTVILVSVLVLAGSVRADDAASVPFAVGEKLTYQVFWGPFVVGRATLEVAGVDPVDGHDCYHLVAKANTSGLIDALFHVDSTAESWLDCEGLFTRRYREDRTEGKHHNNTESHYDYASKQTVVMNHLNGRQRQVPLDQPVQDVISSLYVVRTKNLMLDSDQVFTISADTTNYCVNIHPDERKLIWVKPFGDVRALRIEPTPTLSVVSANKGRMWFWISDDARHLPLLVNSDLKFGSAKLVLYSVTNGKAAPATARKRGDASVSPSPMASNAGSREPAP